MNLDELAQTHQGFYSAPVILKGTKANPLVRVAWLNAPEHAMGVEIRGEADIFVGGELPNS